MMKSELLDKLYLLKLDTSALSDEAKPGYQFALKRVILLASSLSIGCVSTYSITLLSAN